MSDIKQKYVISSTLNKVWEALVNPKEISAWGGGPAKMSDEVGFEFKLWGGDVHGKNLVVKNQKQLVQEWVSGDWETPSLVTFNLKQKNDKVEIELINENVPADEEKDISEGWKDYYLGSIKTYLENK